MAWEEHNIIERARLLLKVVFIVQYSDWRHSWRMQIIAFASPHFLPLHGLLFSHPCPCYHCLLILSYSPCLPTSILLPNSVLSQLAHHQLPQFSFLLVLLRLLRNFLRCHSLVLIRNGVRLGVCWWCGCSYGSCPCCRKRMGRRMKSMGW